MKQYFLQRERIIPFNQNNLFWSPVWYLLHCNLVLIRDQNKLFWSMAAKRLSTAKPKRGTGRIQIMLFAASCPALKIRKKGAKIWLFGRFAVFLRSKVVATAVTLTLFTRG